MHEINIKCLDAVTSNPALYVQFKGAHVHDYAHLLVTLNLNTDQVKRGFAQHLSANSRRTKSIPTMNP